MPGVLLPSTLPATAWQTHRIAIWGVGVIGQQLLDELTAAGIRPVAVFDDYAPPGTLVRGHQVRRGAELNAIRPEIIVLATLKSRTRMRARLAELGFQGTIIELPGLDDDIYAPIPSRRIPEIEALHNRHKEIPAFIIGNGPSLKHTDPRLIRHAITIACNNIYLLKNFVPDYYLVTDVLLAEDRASIINTLPYPCKLFPHDLKRWLKHGIFFNVHRVPELTEFSEDFALCSQCNFTVTYSMLQLAFFLGCAPVYLIGLDHNYQVNAQQAILANGVLTSLTDDPNHFHPTYFGKGYRWHVPRLDQMEAGYRLAKAAFERHGRKIFNATAGGQLEIFERVDFYKAISLTQTETKT